jgi:transcription-repair coupling factor (superfamily II helicase)
MILPLVSELLSRVARRPAVLDSLESVRNTTVRAKLSGLTDPAKALVTAFAAAHLNRPVVLVVESNNRAEEMLELTRYFYEAFSRKPASRVMVLPAHDVMPFDGRSPHAQISERRGTALWRIAAGEADVVVVPVSAALMRLREPEFYEGLASRLEREQELPQEEFLGHLARVGYERLETVESPGEYAVRGGIVDVFSPEAAGPVRLEFFGDTLESLREFDPETQRSQRKLERATILPLTDYPRGANGWRASGNGAGGGVAVAEEDDGWRTAAGEGEGFGGNEDEEALAVPVFGPGWEFSPEVAQQANSNLLELMPRAVILEEEPEGLAKAVEKYRARLAAGAEKAGEEKGDAARYVLGDDEWAAAESKHARLALSHLAMESNADVAASAAGISIVQRTLLCQPTARYLGNVPAFMTEVRNRIESGEQVMASAASTGEMERLADLCHEYDMSYRIGDIDESVTTTRLAEEASAGTVSGNQGGLVLVKAPLASGVSFPEAKLTIYGNSDLFETVAAPARQKARPKSASFFSDFSDLKPGDHVVHVDHGIGRFEGLRQIEVGSAMSEFMLLTYAEEARLYVPLARLDLLQKYQSLGGSQPQLDRLGTNQWETRKARVKKAVGDMAQKLLALYADRKAVPGHAFPTDSSWQREFEDAFEFQETTDQEKAIEDVKKDLQSSQPMDRLLCGDVGYGKTEVAMRAAFKVIADSRQVAVLAPTTILAFQHYETFRKRLAAFPLRVEMLSRFRTAAQQKKILEDLEAGKVDVVIGTHRLLSKDVKFRDLGLLVVDEEQRFGVAHKERIKEMRKNVDVLTMSATPIPRTLHMSLVGLRDMSLIETPPKDRLAIQTTVAPFSETIVQRAIEQEMERGGQVFFVHNRVESIHSVAAMVKRLVPSARVLVGHGQMREAELEKVMLKFIQRGADVLVATTIIENGLDIPQANTIIINRADRLGLSELYQLRGRVGRSNQRAYAYLLVPPHGQLTELARKRLAALQEFSELGAGFRIAALDLELRGAGNILGREQHGQIESVGFDLYCRLLERAVAERKGEAVASERHVTLNLGVDIRIPTEYIESENLRLRIYKRIAEVSNEEQREEVWRELQDRFGPPPPGAANLLDYAVLKAQAERLAVNSIERRGDQVAIRFYEETPVEGEKFVGVIREHSGKGGLRLDPKGVLWMDWKTFGRGVLESVQNVLRQLQA